MGGNGARRWQGSWGTAGAPYLQVLATPLLCCYWPPCNTDCTEWNGFCWLPVCYFYTIQENTTRFFWKAMQQTFKSQWWSVKTNLSPPSRHSCPGQYAPSSSRITIFLCSPVVHWFIWSAMYWSPNLWNLLSENVQMNFQDFLIGCNLKRNCRIQPEPVIDRPTTTIAGALASGPTNTISMTKQPPLGRAPVSDRPPTNIHKRRSNQKSKKVSRRLYNCV